MIPSFRLKFTILAPKDTPRPDDIVDRVRYMVKVAGRRAAQYAKYRAPGKVLKRKIGVIEETTATGGISTIWMPEGLWFTLPPGTQPHFIPGGLAVSSKTAAAQIQRAKGYPMRFYWEKVGAVVRMWGVSHPGYQPKEDWGAEVTKYTADILRQEEDSLIGYISQRWGGSVQAI